MSEDLTKVGVKNAEIEVLEGDMLKGPLVPLSRIWTHAPGVSVGEMHVPANTDVLGHEHKTRHLNILLKGACEILAGDKTIHLKAPCVFVADPGVRKLARFTEESIWLNVLPNPTDETDDARLEEMFVVKSATYLAHVDSLKAIEQASD